MISYSKKLIREVVNDTHKLLTLKGQEWHCLDLRLLCGLWLQVVASNKPFLCSRESLCIISDNAVTISSPQLQNSPGQAATHLPMLQECLPRRKRSPVEYTIMPVPALETSHDKQETSLITDLVKRRLYISTHTCLA